MIRKVITGTIYHTGIKLGKMDVVAEIKMDDANKDGVTNICFGMAVSFNNSDKDLPTLLRLLADELESSYTNNAFSLKEKI